MRKAPRAGALTREGRRCRRCLPPKCEGAPRRRGGGAGPPRRAAVATLNATTLIGEKLGVSSGLLKRLTWTSCASRRRVCRRWASRVRRTTRRMLGGTRGSKPGGLTPMGTRPMGWPPFRDGLRGESNRAWELLTRPWRWCWTYRRDHRWSSTTTMATRNAGRRDVSRSSRSWRTWPRGRRSR